MYRNCSWILGFVILFAEASDQGCYQQDLSRYSISFVASYVSTLQKEQRTKKLRWNPTRHTRLSPELSLKQKFTLNHVQLMKLLPMLTI